ncbi:HD domain protein [Bacteriovorax sp. BSW11_IV]|uniref:hypothetical protein n=1 Tax=Bacteriovorax sp. BSW11_IV TaxID=1353529 RepID=UPI00038A48E0|nr:hypothetical protein [Bacteriovorax sp. BSW11_IV]EQC49219.1 HD domain protein [Bacteriovorax sp. BSW11_IV]
MHKVLLISDNDLLRALYVANLQVYVNSETKVCTHHNEGIEILDSGEHFNVVICQNTIGEDHAGVLIYQHILENDIDSECIILGREEDVPEEVNVIGDPMNMQALIRLCAEKLGVKARDMALLDVPQMFPFSIRMFFSLEKSPCDVYLKSDENFNLIFTKDQGIWPEIRKYVDKDISNFYVHASDRLLLINNATQKIIKELHKKRDGNATLEKIDVAEQGFETVAQAFFDKNGPTKEVVALSNECMNMMQEVVTEVPDLKGLIILLTQNKSGFLYAHSIIAAFVSDFILSNISWGSNAHKDKLKFVLFFHDLYLGQIYTKFPDLAYEDQLVLDKRLSDEEKEIVLAHAAKAAEAVAKFPKAPMGVDAIIRQHHGTTNGLGFAITYKDDISPLAKVLIIAEAFTEYILKALKEEGKKANKADVISELKEKFPKHTYIKIIETLEDFPF